jgi:hypothetical protein
MRGCGLNVSIMTILDEIIDQKEASQRRRRSGLLIMCVYRPSPQGVELSSPVLFFLFLFLFNTERGEAFGWRILVRDGRQDVRT